MPSRCAFAIALLLCIVVGPARADDIRWTLATGLKDGSKVEERLVREARNFSRKTDGRLRIDVTGADAESNSGFAPVLSRDGHFDAALVPAFEYAQLVGTAALYGQPFLFTGLDEVRAIRQRFDAEFIGALQHEDFLVLGVIGLGFSYLMSDHAFTSLAEVEGMTVELPINAQWMFEMLSTMSLQPRFGGAQTGASLKLNSPNALIIDRNLPRPDYLVLPPVQYGYMLLLVRRPSWNDLPSDDQLLIGQFFANIISDLDDDAARLSARSILLLQKRGMKILQLPQKDVDRLGRLHYAGRADSVLQEKLIETLAELRQQPGTSADP